MASLRTLQRTAERCISVQLSAYVCQSCRTRIASRQFSTAPAIQIAPAATFAKRSFSSSTRLQADEQPALPDDRNPAKDPNYVEALSWEGLERVGGEKWVEKQMDKRDKFAGWLQKRDSNLTPEDATRVVRKTVDELLESSGTTSLAEALKGSGSSEEWLSFPIQDPSVKFEIVKRITEQTGARLSDYTVQNITTLAQLRDAILRRPAPKKIAKKLTTSKTLEGLPNVSIANRRVTPIDREKKIGRWKLIEQELLDRGLPVTGSNTKVKQSIVI